MLIKWFRLHTTALLCFLLITPLVSANHNDCAYSILELKDRKNLSSELFYTIDTTSTANINNILKLDEHAWIDNDNETLNFGQLSV